MLLEVKCMMGATKSCFPICNDCVPSLRQRLVLWLPAPNHYRDVVTPCRSTSQATGQVIREYDTSWHKTIQKPVLDGIACKSAHAIGPEMNRPVFFAHFPSCDQGNLVL